MQLTTQSDNAQSGSERSPGRRNAIGAVLLLVLLLSVALGIKLSSVWLVAISVPVCAVCQYLVASHAPLVAVPSKKVFEQKVAAYVFLGLLLLLFLGVVFTR